MTVAHSARVPVNEVRDYRRVNADVLRLLNAGHRRIDLTGVEGQRLLLVGLTGPWEALVDLDGPAGPELAAGLDAPNIIVRAPAASDGAARGLRAGQLMIAGPAGDGLAYEMTGGVLVVTGPAGHRAGLRMLGGTLVLLGPAGRLTADRQRGGTIFAERSRVGPWARHGATGGSFELFDEDARPDALSNLLRSLTFAEIRP